MSPRWFVVAALTLACSESSDGSGAGGASAFDAAGSGAKPPVTGSGGASAGGDRASGGAAGKSSPRGGADQGGLPGTAGNANTGGAITGGSGGDGSGDGGAAELGGAGGQAGVGNAGAGPVPGGFLPFSDYVPNGDPIALPGIVNASDIAWKPETDSFFLLPDRVAEFYEYGPDFAEPLRVIAIENGPVDAEALAYLGSHAGLDRFALGTEANDNVVLIFDLAPDATTVDMNQAVLQSFEPAEAPPVANKGYEGVAYRPENGGEGAWLYVCEEGEPDQTPIRVLRFPYSEDAPRTSSFRDGSLVAEEPWNAVEKLGSVAGDLSSLYFDGDTNTLLVLSDRGSRLLRVDPNTGDILDQLVLDRSPQYEGVTLASGGRLVVVSEPNFVEIFSIPGI